MFYQPSLGRVVDGEGGPGREGRGRGGGYLRRERGYEYLIVYYVFL